MIGCCVCGDCSWQLAIQVASVIVAAVAVWFACQSANRQNAEAARENRISLLNRRMVYLDLLKVLSKCLSTALDSPRQCSGDGSFSAAGFSAQLEEYMRSNPILLQVLQENLTDFNVKGKAFFKESSRCLIEKLNEGVYIFEADDVKKAIESLGAVFKLAGGWCIDDGILLSPPAERDLHTSSKTAIVAIAKAVKAGIGEMKI